MRNPNLSAANSQSVPPEIHDLSRIHCEDVTFRAVENERERAGRELLALPPPPGNGPEPDWEEQKREMLDARMRKWDDDFEGLPDDLTEFSETDVFTSLLKYLKIRIH